MSPYQRDALVCVSLVLAPGLVARGLEHGWGWASYVAVGALFATVVLYAERGRRPPEKPTPLPRILVPEGASKGDVPGVPIAGPVRVDGVEDRPGASENCQLGA